MCNILAIDHLIFDNSTWTFQLHDTSCQLSNGAFSSEAFQHFIYSKNNDMENPYILFGTGVIKEDVNQDLSHDHYCILLKQVDNKKQAFLVHTDDFKMEFMPHPITFTLC
jgi:hypothetical protein